MSTETISLQGRELFPAGKGHAFAKGSRIDDAFQGTVHRIDVPIPGCMRV